MKTINSLFLTSAIVLFSPALFAATYSATCTSSNSTITAVVKPSSSITGWNNNWKALVRELLTRQVVFNGSAPIQLGSPTQATMVINNSNGLMKSGKYYEVSLTGGAYGFNGVFITATAACPPVRFSY